MPTPGQLAFAFGGPSAAVPARTRRPAKPHHRPRVDAPLLPLASPRFLPVVGVPATRKDCPDTTKGHCQFVRCRYHLFLEEASTRAGRPGLSSVQRNERGLTVSQPGHVGNERAGTTVNPRWLRLRDEPAEVERVCPAWIWVGDDGQIEINVDPARWTHMRVSAGDALDIVNQIDSLRVTWARVGSDNESVILDGYPPAYEAMFVFIVRKRLVQSCALDVIDRLGKQTNEDAGFHLSRHRTLVARINRVALQKAGKMSREMGMDDGDLVEALMGMGER